MTHAQPFWADLHSILSEVLGATSLGEPVKPLDPETARAVCALILSGLFVTRAGKNFGLWKKPAPQGWFYSLLFLPSADFDLLLVPKEKVQ